jgi:hypothetical protein
MKTIAYVAIFALFLITLATPRSASARVSSPSTSGSFRIVLEDGLTKQVEFNARLEGQGATGEMTFRDEARITGQDPESEDRPEEPTEFSMTAVFDSLTIENNRAVMGGVVRESSHSSYVGKFVQLVVEDNGDDTDRLTWCFCQPEPGGWVPVDAENPRDEGAWMSWWATDAELRDDVGVQSANIIPGSRRGCPSFSLSTYEFPDQRGEGQIQVLP